METQEAGLALHVLVCKKSQMLYEVSTLDFKMAPACNSAAGPVRNPFILQPFVAFAEPGLLLMVSVGVANCRLYICFF